MRSLYLYTYSIPSGKNSQHEAWVRTHGEPFWRAQRGFRDFHCYKTLIGTGPDMVALVAFDSADDITHALEAGGAMALWEEFEQIVDELETKVLVEAVEAELPAIEVAHT
jgi:hypothetical protein